MDEQTSRLLAKASGLARAYLAGLGTRPVGVPVDPARLRSVLDGVLPFHGTDPEQVVGDLAAAMEPGIVATAGPRYFGFVIGGALPVTVATSWLQAAWDQNAGNYASSPAASVVEEVAGRWLLQLFDLPRDASVGFVTGGTMANFVGLAAGRHAVLRDAGWDVESDGLFGAPPVRVIVGEEAHTTIFVSLRLLGLGASRVIRIPADGQGRMRPDALAAELARHRGPTIVCAQAGNVNTGAFDALRSIGEAVRGAGGWLHVDGAFGLWAAASDRYRPLLDGLDRAHSWATDAHKTLNVPHDCGVVLCADPEAHRAAMNVTAPYLVRGTNDAYSPYDWVPESSRSPRGLHVYAALRTLGRAGVAAQVERFCTLARRAADRLAASELLEVANDVAFTQILVRCRAAGGAATSDVCTAALAKAVQEDGTCWLGTTTWRDRLAIRISISNWSTTEADVDRSVDVILRCAARI